MPESTKSIPITFANTGMVLRSAPDEIPITAYKALVNVITDRENSISVRRGFTRLNNGLPSAPHSTYILKDPTGQLWRFAIVAGQLYVAGVSPVASDFVAVSGGSGMSAAADPRAFFANYTLIGSEIKPYIFAADGAVLRKTAGDTDPSRRVGIPAPVSGLTSVTQTANTLQLIEDFDNSGLWAASACSLSNVTGVTGNALQMVANTPGSWGTAVKALSPNTQDLNSANLDEPIQVWIQFPLAADLTNFKQATILFNLSTTPGDTSFANYMWRDLDITGILPGTWVLLQLPKKDFIFAGVNASLNWSTVTAIRMDMVLADVLIDNPGQGNAKVCAMYWDECSLNTTGQVVAPAPDVQWTFTYYNSKTDTESDFAPAFPNPYLATNFSQYSLVFPACPAVTPPLAFADQIRVYRMGGTLLQFQFIGDTPYTPGIVPATFVDKIPDAGAGNPLETDNQLPPDKVKGVEIYDNRLWTWGGEAVVVDPVTGYPIIVTEPPNRVRFSKRVNVEEFPAENFIYVGSGSEAVQRLLEYDGQLFVFTTTKVYTIAGTDLNTYQPVSTAVNQGLRNPFGLTRGVHGIFMQVYDGVYEFPSGRKISEPVNQLFFGEKVNDMPPIALGRETECSMGFWNSKVYFSYPMTKNLAIVNDGMIIWDTIYERWHFYMYGAQGLFFEPDTNILVGANLVSWAQVVDGSPVTFNYSGAWPMQLENGFVDICTDVTRGIFWDVDTKEFDLGYPDQEKRFIDYVLDVDTQGFPLLMQVAFDGAPFDVIGSVNTNKRDQQILPVLLGEGEGMLARRVALRFNATTDAAATNPTRIYKVIHRILLEPMRHRTFVTEWTDYGNPMPKFFRELWVELDTFGFPLDSIEVQIDQAIGAVIKANTTSNGRTKFFYGLPPDLRGTLGRLKIIPKDQNEVKLYDHSIITIPEPPKINAYQMPWSEEQWPYEKLWKEIVFDIDTDNQVIAFDFWLDGDIVQSFDLQAPGRRLITKSLDQDLFGKLGRITVNASFLDSFCCLPQGVRIYGIRYVVDKDPADVTFSDTYEQLMSYDRTKVLRRFWIAMKNPDADVTMKVYVDDVLASTKVITADPRATGHSKRKVDLESDIKGRLVRVLFSSPFAFKLYWEKSEIEMKGTNPEDGYGRYKLAPPQTL